MGVAAGGALAATRAAAIAALTVGQTVWGDVRKLESFGTFIQLDGAGARPSRCESERLGLRVGGRFRDARLLLLCNTLRPAVGLMTTY